MNKWLSIGVAPPEMVVEWSAAKALSDSNEKKNEDRVQSELTKQAVEAAREIREDKKLSNLPYKWMTSEEIKEPLGYSKAQNAREFMKQMVAKGKAEKYDPGHHQPIMYRVKKWA